MANPKLKIKKAQDAFLKNKTVLVTGGTGTFGRAFIARLLKVRGIKKIIVFSRDELKQSEMQALYPKEPRLRFFIGDIRDVDRLKRAFKGVDVVVHAAALKQVPATEYNPFEAIQTNILGSRNVIDAAIDTKVSKAILISSDKAVEPINLYGATKLCAEKLFVAANSYSGESKTALGVVRYGNVIGSRGSLVELIARNRSGGVITITHEEMTRFWIHIEQVVEVVLGALQSMQGGEIFIPKMKNMSVSNVVRLLAPECRQEITGIRPGEKLHEVLMTKYEIRRARELLDFFVVPPEFGLSNPVWLHKHPRAPESLIYSSDNQKHTLNQKEARTLFSAR